MVAAWFNGVAAALCAAMALIHVVVGGREVAGPLKRSGEGLDRGARATAYYCWHMVSIVLTGLSVAFAYVAFTADLSLSVAATGLATAFCGLGLLQLAAWRLPIATLPQGLLFLPVALLGAAGVVTLSSAST